MTLTLATPTLTALTLTTPTHYPHTHHPHTHCPHTHRSPSVGCVVSLGRVDFGQQEASLTAVLLRHDVTRHWKPSLQDLLGVVHWGLEQLTKVLVVR